MISIVVVVVSVIVSVIIIIIIIIIIIDHHLLVFLLSLMLLLFIGKTQNYYYHPYFSYCSPCQNPEFSVPQPGGKCNFFANEGVGGPPDAFICKKSCIFPQAEASKNLEF